MNDLEIHLSILYSQPMAAVIWVIRLVMVGVIWVMRLVMVVVMEAELFCTRLASGNRLLQVLVYVTTIRKPKEKEQDVEEEKLAVI